MAYFPSFCQRNCHLTPIKSATHQLSYPEIEGARPVDLQHYARKHSDHNVSSFLNSKERKGKSHLLNLLLLSSSWGLSYIYFKRKVLRLRFLRIDTVGNNTAYSFVLSSVMNSEVFYLWRFQLLVSYYLHYLSRPHHLMIAWYCHIFTHLKRLYDSGSVVVQSWKHCWPQPSISERVSDKRAGWVGATANFWGHTRQTKNTIIAAPRLVCVLR